ncbi:MAG: DnaJ domain-containing protein [Blastocatellia bacterium]|nr:DnaJ domain-containing protein [Blastocatellia bacterium]
MASLYAILGVDRTATQTEIKSAYRRLARKYHPDVNKDPSAAARFAQITDAYHTLIDPERRRDYDRTGRTGSAAAENISPQARAARRAYYQSRADKIVNEWLEREREETRARGKAVYTTVTLFFSTFMVGIMRPNVFEISNVFFRAALIVLFGIGIWHLFKSLNEHLDHYTYRPERISITHTSKASKPYKRSVAWGFVLTGYLISLLTGILIGMVTFGKGAIVESLFSVLFYPPIAVLVLDIIYKINAHFEST